MLTVPVTLALFALVIVLLRLGLRHRPLKALKGPPSPSFLTGNEYQLRYQEQVGDLQFAWSTEYGMAYRLAGCLGEDILRLSDPKALQHVMQASAYRYPQTRIASESVRMLLGKGLVWASGEIHQRQRKAMNPAFSAAQTRTYLPIFQADASKLVRKWTEEVADTPKILNITRPLASVSLDAIGAAAFKYPFNSLDSHKGSLMKVYDNLLVDVNMWPNKWDLVMQSIWCYLPPTVISWMSLLPLRAYRRMRNFLKLSMETVKDILESHVEDESGRTQNDVLSLLARAASSTDPKIHMDDIEVQSQMATFMLAGHETTSSSIAWALYELSKHRDIQEELRKEIINVRASLNSKKQADYNSSDLESMPLLNAVIKETLRLHPIVPQLTRVAACDDVIPLSRPVVAHDGTMITEIPIRKGQTVHIDIATYNRLPQLWGENAGDWVPERFRKGKDAQKKVSSVGVYENLMTFSAGVKACIGWRFAILEMQTIIAELVEKFNFSIPTPAPDILRAPAGAMVPMIRGQPELGVCMPLEVALVEL